MTAALNSRSLLQPHAEQFPETHVPALWACRSPSPRNQASRTSKHAFQLVGYW